MSSTSDPLVLGDLDPQSLAARQAAKNTKEIQPNTSADVARAREERLQKAESRKAQQQATRTVSEPAPKPDKDVDAERAERSGLLDKLEAYRARFPHLKKRNNVTAKSSVDEIYDELHWCEVQLGSARETNLGAQIMLATASLTEIGSQHFNPLGLNLNGLTNVTRENMAEFQPILDELMIKYGASMYVTPEWRLAMAFGACVYTVHNANSGAARQMDEPDTDL